MMVNLFREVNAAKIRAQVSGIMVEAIGSPDGTITYEQVIANQDQQQNHIAEFLKDLGLSQEGDILTKDQLFQVIEDGLLRENLDAPHF